MRYILLLWYKRQYTRPIFPATLCQMGISSYRLQSAFNYKKQWFWSSIILDYIDNSTDENRDEHSKEEVEEDTFSRDVKITQFDSNICDDHWIDNKHFKNHGIKTKLHFIAIICYLSTKTRSGNINKLAIRRTVNMQRQRDKFPLLSASSNFDVLMGEQNCKALAPDRTPYVLASKEIP